MIQHLHIPAPPLDQFIDFFFYYTDFYPEHSVDRLLPDGEVRIIFELSQNTNYIYDNDSLEEIQICRNVWFSGFRTEPITIPAGKGSEMIVVQFQKGRAFPFLSPPIDSITNLVIDGEQAMNNHILTIWEQLVAAKGVSRKFALLERELMRGYAGNFEANPFVTYFLDELHSNPTQVNLKRICEKVGYSQKHLIQLFRKDVGVTPKEFLKIIRFQKAIHEIEAHKTVNWARIAQDCGFYDQSHFISDFKTFSGLTPGAYMSRKGDEVNYIPMR